MIEMRRFSSGNRCIVASSGQGDLICEVTICDFTVNAFVATGIWAVKNR